MSLHEHRAEHGCGMCNGPLTFDGLDDGAATWTCDVCGHWHIATDCCES